ncbi:hypothetical protein PPYR_09207 [Photinus pyralis]|uniref:Uncharacterized protein n=1 Tax=Photinus pyralis TaxID=7054 RepID=A0A5N4ALM5_PHOPY|nr:uncharacterized protein LOC116171654 [Photinus pyralis]KAB0798214.1 hypothetical protein PPYR_09207 [Photinus pyralis]
MSYRYSTALSHIVLAGTGIYCLNRYHGANLPVCAYSIIVTNSLLGVWRWGNPHYGHKIDRLYNFTSLLQILTSLPLVVTQVWLNLGYKEELAVLHCGASILPFCLYLAGRSKEDIIDASIALNVISLGVISLLHENYYGVAASISYFFNHFFLREGQFDVDIPITDLYNYGLSFFCYFSYRSL